MALSFYITCFVPISRAGTFQHSISMHCWQSFFFLKNSKYSQIDGIVNTERAKKITHILTNYSVTIFPLSFKRIWSMFVSKMMVISLLSYKVTWFEFKQLWIEMSTLNVCLHIFINWIWNQFHERSLAKRKFCRNDFLSKSFNVKLTSNETNETV